MKFDMRYLIICIISLLTAMRSAASAPQIESQTPIASGHAYCFCEDSKGYIWVGMLGELVRYDGLRILKFPIPGEQATTLRTNTIVTLGDDALLLGGDYGLKKFDLRSLSFTDSIPAGGNSVYTLLNIGGSNVLVGRAHGLMLVDGSLATDTITVPHSVNSLSAAVYDIALAPDSSIWITSNYGILRADPIRAGKQLQPKYVVGGAPVHYSRIAASDDRLFLYTSSNSAEQRGLYSYHIASGQLTHIDDLNGMAVSSILVKGSKLYVSTDGAGIFVFDTATGDLVERLTNTSSVFRLLSNGVYSIYISSRDRLYIGYYQNGVQVLSFSPESTFSPYADGQFTTADVSVRTTARNSRYNVTATLDKVMITDEQQHTTRALGIDRFDNTQPISIIPVGDEFAMATFGGGVYMLDPATGAVRHLDGSRGLRVCDIALDNKGRLWVAATEGVFRFVNEKLDKTFTSENSSVKSGTIRIYFDRTGRGWIAGQYGMVAYDPQTDRMRDDVFPKGFINNEFVRCVAESAEGDLLFAYDRNKLFRTDAALKKYGRIHHSLPINQDDINVLHQLPDSSWLVATSSALYATRDFRDFHAFGPRDGIMATKFTPGNSVDTQANTMSLCTDKGLMVADIDRLASPADPASLTISEIRFNGERMSAPMPELDGSAINLQIPPHTGTIDIFFTDFVSQPARPANIEYRLDGDTVWTTLPITRPVSVHYNGDLNRRVEVRPAGMPEGAITLCLNEPSSHKLLWIITICVLALCAAALVAIAYRRRHRQEDLAGAVAPQADDAVASADDANDGEADDAKSSKYRGFKIDDDEMQRLAKRLDLLMYDTKIYRRADLKISQLADELGISTAMLSYYFSQQLKSNYYRYLNSYRIKEFKNMVADGTYHTYTLTAMSQMCGFGSRTSFFRYFKEAEGISPLDYIKQAEDGKNTRSK